jgi:hypothetical protein
VGILSCEHQDGPELHPSLEGEDVEEPWVQKTMPFPPKPTKKKDDEEFERFAEMIRPVFLRTRLTDLLKMPPYDKYMKDIVTKKGKSWRLKYPQC